MPARIVPTSCERFDYEPHHLAGADAALNARLAEAEIRALEEPYTPRMPTWFSRARAAPGRRSSNRIRYDVVTG